MLSSIQPAGGISLRDLFPHAKFVGAGDVRVLSCTTDARTCQPGDLYVALVRADQDGHDAASIAAQRGASAILAERLLPTGNLPLCIVPDTREAFSRLCQSLAGNPSQRMKVVGITGTYGKTCTSLLIGAVLEACGHRVGLMNSLGNCDCHEFELASSSPASHPALAHWLSRMSVGGCSHAVLEASSVALASRHFSGIRFDVGCVTNVRREHLDFHGSITNYRAAKARLLHQLSPDGCAIINADDPGSASLVASRSGPVLTVGLREEASLTAEVVERTISEQTFLISAGCDTIPVRTTLIGDQQVTNCLIAAAVGLTYGGKLTDIVRGLESVKNIPGRLQRLEWGQPYGVFLDQAHTPGAVGGCLQVLRRVTTGRLFCVMSTAGSPQHSTSALARTVEKDADMVVITSGHGDPHWEAENHSYVAEAFQGLAQVKSISDRAEAIGWALQHARPGDCVLVSGSGNDDGITLGGAGVASDAEIVRDQLAISPSGLPTKLAA